MHKLPITRISLAVLCALPLGSAAQEGLKLQRQPTLMLLPPEADELPLFIEADRIQGHAERETEAEGTVRLRRRGQAFSADWMRYDRPLEEINARRDVRIEQGGDIIEGDVLRYNLQTDRGFMDNPVYTLRPATPDLAPAASGEPKPRFTEMDARGKADKLLFEGPQQYLAQNARYTTCGPGNDDWYIRADELKIDKNRDVGTARGASIVFMDHTIFYSPYMSFSLHQQRKSGFLTPHYGSSNTSGLELTVPYYWNIAPNYDATFYPRSMTKRGTQLATDFRYLDTTYRGNARVELLPSDQQAGRDRYGYFIKHAQTFSNGWSGSLNVNRVSDDKYFTDLSTLVAITSQTTLPNEGLLTRSGSWGTAGNYSFSAFAQRWQTLQTDTLAPITPPYNRQPQLSLTAFHQNLARTDFDLLASYVDFDHPTLVNGRRALAYPTFTLPLQTSAAYLTPKVGLHVTRYMLDKDTTTLPDRTRVLPIFTTEAGLVMERDTRFTGMNFTQTLEPKLYYVKIPYRDQSLIPNFESGVQDVNFTSMFSENQFSGQDRINDADQLTVGLTSRLIHPESGIERLRMAVAQRYYFESQRVTLPGVPARPDQTSSSDLLAAVSGTILPHWTAEAGWQYNTNASQVQKLNIATRYQPGPGKVLNLAYRDTINLIKQTDISVQWPLTGPWTVVGRWNWSIQDNRTLEGLAGFEYDGGCWAFRAVAHRFATATQASSTSIFLQLELNGVSRIGSNPLDVLRRSIGGYTAHDPRAPRQQEYYIPDR
jgi:LPS-assembly protein